MFADILSHDYALALIASLDGMTLRAHARDLRAHHSLCSSISPQHREFAEQRRSKCLGTCVQRE